MGRASRRKAPPLGAGGVPSWAVAAPKTGLWRGQWRLTLFLYGLAGIGIVATVGASMVGAPLTPAAAGDAAVETSPWLRWVGENWSWFRLLPAGLATGILVALHRPRSGVVQVVGAELRLIVGRRVVRVDLDRATAAWERWPGYPAAHARAFLRLADGATTFRIGLPDVPAGASLPVAPARHAAPDAVMQGAAFAELRTVLRARGLVVDPAAALARDDARAAAPDRAPAGAGARVLRLVRRIPLGLRLLVLVAGLSVLGGLGLVALVDAGVLSERLLPLFSLVVIGVWAAIGIKLRNR